MTAGVRTILREAELEDNGNAARNINSILMGIYLRLESLEGRLAGVQTLVRNILVFNVTGGGGGGGTFIPPNFFQETFTVGANVESSFPRTFNISTGTVMNVFPAQVTASDGSYSVSGGWATWTYAAPTITVAYLPGLESGKTYTITWQIEVV